MLLNGSKQSEKFPFFLMHSLGFFQVLYGIMSWTVDPYQQYSASSLGAAILVHNLVGAVFPFVGNPMYGNLGRHWASSLIAFLGIPLIPCVDNLFTVYTIFAHLVLILFSISWFFFFQRSRHSSKESLGCQSFHGRSRCCSLKYYHDTLLYLATN